MVFEGGLAVIAQVIMIIISLGDWNLKIFAEEIQLVLNTSFS